MSNESGKIALIHKPLFVLAGIGVIAGIAAAYYYSLEKPAEPPVFNPAPNPYARGIYANGIVESFQTNGENINIYPEVGGTVTKILVAEGQPVRAGSPLLQLDDSVQRATAEQLKSQADAALAVLEELKAEPRKETLEVSIAQVDAARASLRNVHDQLRKVKDSYRIDPKSVSKNDLDNAINARKVAQRNLEVAERQYELTKAGAWIYDIRNQERQYNALTKQYESASALLAKYVLKAPSDGVILSIKTAVGSYVSSQGVYGTYTEGFNPIIVMGGSAEYLQVRTYVDEILVHRLPDPTQMNGQMFIRGTDIKVPLEYVRVQPYVSPKIELSDQRQERVDVRVLPLIFKFAKPKDVNIYPGQLVDVYLGEKQLAQLPGQAPGEAHGGRVKK
ncbi:MAG: biotin/lipoyl-binding protein [Oligoflexia bacterium]|nr:biotin/lipoyl-binding protein [Oligoflexia bacterium]